MTLCQFVALGTSRVDGVRGKGTISMNQVIATFRNSIPKVLGWIAMGSIMTFGAATIVLARNSPSLEVAIAGYIGLFGFGLCTLLFISWLFQFDPVIEVSAAGIRYGRWRKEFILWEAIAGMATQKVFVHEILILWVQPQPTSRQAVKHTIMMSGLDGSLSDLLDAIRIAQAYTLDGTSADRIGAKRG